MPTTTTKSRISHPCKYPVSTSHILQCSHIVLTPSPCYCASNCLRPPEPPGPPFICAVCIRLDAQAERGLGTGDVAEWGGRYGEAGAYLVDADVALEMDRLRVKGWRECVFADGQGYRKEEEGEMYESSVMSEGDVGVEQDEDRDKNKNLNLGMALREHGRVERERERQRKREDERFWESFREDLTGREREEEAVKKKDMKKNADTESQNPKQDRGPKPRREVKEDESRDWDIVDQIGGLEIGSERDEWVVVNEAWWEKDTR